MAALSSVAEDEEGFHGEREELKKVALNCDPKLLEMHDVLKERPDVVIDEEDQYLTLGHAAKGFLHMQRNTGQWRWLWCELANGELSYRTDEGSEVASGIIRVSFCAIEEEEKISIRNEATRYATLYWSYINSLESPFVFWICSAMRTYLFRADTEELRDFFLDKAYTFLEDSQDSMVLARKAGAMKEMLPYLREQFVNQTDQYNNRIETLTQQQGYEEELPITSTRKEKSGVLSMETNAPGDQRWADFYFVLFEGSLYHYKDSKSTTPTGFISLRRACIYLDTGRLAQGEFVFKLQTPLRTLVCRAKHAVALAEWASCLEKAISQFKTSLSHKERRLSRRTSLMVLEDIDRLVGNVFTLKMLLKSSAGTRTFKQYLTDSSKARCKVPDVDFFNALESFSKSKLTGNAIYDKAKPIWDHFCRTENKDTHVNLPADIYNNIDEELPLTTSLTLFDDAHVWLKDRLECDLKDFAKTKEFLEFKRHADKLSASKKRVVEPFKDGYQQSFILKVNKARRSREVIFSRKQCVFTIGRDKSNVLVIEDSRVSRSHARVEYTERQCEYIDLGSSCGSKLNGKPVLRTKLQAGDVVELGQSTLIFTLKKKTKFFNWFNFGGDKG